MASSTTTLGSHRPWRQGLGAVARPWTWSWRGWLIASVLFIVSASAGAYAWVWHQYRAGVEELDRYHPQAALAHLNSYLAIWSNDSHALLLAARAARRAGDLTAAESYLARAERGHAPSQDVVLEWSLLRASSGALSDEVENFLYDAAKEPEQSLLVWEALTEGYTRVYRVREAFLCVDRWLKQDPNNVQALYLRGTIQRQIKLLNRAVPDYQRVVDLDPSRSDARKWLALGLVESGRFAEALVHFDRLERETPGDADLLIFRARAYKGLGRNAEARQLLDGLLAEQPHLALALRVRGEVELGERPAEAEKWLRRAVEAGPFEYQSHFLLLQALIQEGKEEDAKKQRIEADNLKERVERLGDLMATKMSARSHDPALHTEMGTLLLSLGHKEEGRTWLESALQQDPTYQPAHAALADWYQAAGDREKAALHRQAAGKE
jgi:predicted Zn-dependent protease